MQKRISLLYILLLLLLMASPCFAEGWYYASGTWTCNADYCQTFNDTETPTSWTVVDTVGNFDYTTSPAPLEGAQSLAVYYDDDYGWVRYDPNFGVTEIWFSFWVQSNNLLGDISIFRLTNSSGTNIAFVRADSGTGEQWGIYNGTSSSAGGSSISTELQKVLVYYKAETTESAADGILTVYEWNGSSWVQACTLTNGGYVDNVDSVSFYNSNSSAYVLIIDMFKWDDDTQIPSPD